MQEYIDTFKACALLGIPYNQSRRLSHDFGLTAKKEFTSKVWSRPQIEQILAQLREKARPPKGWIQLAEAADILGWSQPVSRSLLLAHGLKPKLFRLWKHKRRQYRQTPCWHKATVQHIATQIRRSHRKHPPEGWLTFSEVMDYLSANKDRARTLIRRYNAGYRKISPRHYFYAEDDIIAIRRFIKTPKHLRPASPYDLPAES